MLIIYTQFHTAAIHTLHLRVYKDKKILSVKGITSGVLSIFRIAHDQNEREEIQKATIIYM